MSGRVDIFGAGQCGALLATMLAKRGFSVDLYERSADPRLTGIAAGRSINLALAARGIHALEKIGVLDRIRPLLVPMRGRLVHAADGSTEFLPYGQHESEQIYSVSRGHLNQLLLDVAEDTGNVTLHFGQRVTGYDADRARVLLSNAGDGADYAVAAEPAIAADGAGSMIRQALDSARNIGASEQLLAHGYKELAIPAGPGGEFLLEANALHIWPRGDFMLIALPNPGGDFTLTLFLPNKGEAGFESLDTEQSVTLFFEQYFADVAPLISGLPRAVIENPLGLLGTIRCQRWHDAGRVLLIGDAAHAIVPFHGQGMNLAFEDCIVLAKILDELGADWPAVFARYESEQLANANAIADMALENYIEMRDTVRDPRFALQKQVSFELERRLPGLFIPRYSMVMFHAEIPYSVAQQRGATQLAILEEFTEGCRSLTEVDLDGAAAAVRQRLAPL